MAFNGDLPGFTAGGEEVSDLDRLAALEAALAQVREIAAMNAGTCDTCGSKCGACSAKLHEAIDGAAVGDPDDPAMDLLFGAMEDEPIPAEDF